MITFDVEIAGDTYPLTLDSNDLIENLLSLEIGQRIGLIKILLDSLIEEKKQDSFYLELNKIKMQIEKL